MKNQLVSANELISDLSSKMRNGEIEALNYTRTLLESYDFIELSQQTNSREFLALYTIRHLVFDVLSNLTGDATFSFPRKDGKYGQKLAEVIINASMFLQSALEGEAVGSDNLSKYAALEKAVNIYYDLLYSISQIASESDITTLD